MSLKEPHLKMSKSHQDPRSRIQINDDPGLIRDKIRLALTDSIPGVSFDLENRPGVSNLLTMMSYFDGQRRSPEHLARFYEARSMREFKTEAAEIISDGLAMVRNRYNHFISADSSHYLEDIAVEGSAKARSLAEKTMSKVRKVVGLS